MPSSETLFHVAPVLVMATMLFINHVLNGRRTRQRNELEASRLATALCVEFQSMLQHYVDDLRLLSEGAPILLGIRGVGQVFRGNTNRLPTLLDERELAAVVAAHAHHERIEALLIACTQPNSGFTLRPSADAAYRQQLRERFMAGCEMVEAAMSALSLAWPITTALDAPPPANEGRDLALIGAGQVD